MSKAKTVAPELVDTASRELDMVAARRIDQIAQRSEETIQKIAPGIIKGAIEELYKAPFRLLGQFGHKKITNLDQKYLKG